MDRQNIDISIDVDVAKYEFVSMAFSAALGEIPSEYRLSAKLQNKDKYDNTGEFVLVYSRPETDEEQVKRIRLEDIARERQAEFDAKAIEVLINKQRVWLFSELLDPIKNILVDISENWNNKITGQGYELKCSVPMADGRDAGVVISVIARDRIKNVD